MTSIYGPILSNGAFDNGSDIQFLGDLGKALLHALVLASLMFARSLASPNLREFGDQASVIPSAK